MLHSLADLLLYARLSSAAYLLEDMAALEAVLKTLAFDLRATIKKDSCEAFVAEDARRIVVVHQGTRVRENTSPAEIWADLDCDPIDLGNGVVVHDGFYSDLRAAWPMIEAALPKDGRPVYAMGHSLGGSRAHLTPIFTPCNAVSFGAPKAGNPAYWISPCWSGSTLCRVVREQDFAPEWPFFMLRWPFIPPFVQPEAPFLWLRGGMGSLVDARLPGCLTVGDHSDARYEMDLVRLAGQVAPASIPSAAGV